MNRRSTTRPLHVATILTALGVVSLAHRPNHAGANNWPPPPGANMQDPNNWPNDPGYGPTLNGKPDPKGSGGQWNYISWLPTQDKGTGPYLGADQKLGASGMSIDIGWTYSIGIPDVKIAVLDSGIEWEKPDIVNKAFLNAAELTGAKRPQDRMGNVCGGTGALAGYDCNADGVFSIADYRDDPRLAPTVPGEPCFQDAERTVKGSDRIKGDINRNCILDAGDLIDNPLFSDGVDDDANGYTDDISGWDFYKNDNNPYDDTRYGHGTGESHDSSAEGNNGLDSVGTCPNCRFMMLRVGDSFIADANDFAKAVVYATDNGVKVVQEALGTVDQTAFSKAAIDYAYAHNVTIIASMADENSRHHNMPAVANHVLPVHAITYNGDSDTSSTSFLSFNTCTNYGGQNMLSVSGKSCSSEATGRSAGIAGLLYSAAKSRMQPLDLTAEEVMQLLKMTADDIDVAESRSGDPNVSGRYYESKPGWDQRFGYGRINVGKALKAINDGLIPPEVDLTDPAWFEVLYADRRSGPVPIKGRVAAARASKYDYVVEWAPGVEPDDAQFQTLASVPNVPGSTVSGGDALAQLDPSQIDTTHVADPDSPHHENDRTITVRVRATAYYGNAQVRGEARRTLAVVNRKNGLDADLLPGFPVKLGASMEAGAKLADIDGDGVRDIVAASSDGVVHVFSLKSGMPVEIPGFPYKTAILDGINPTVTDPGVPSYLNAPAYHNGKNGGVDADVAREAIIGSPAVGDLTGDGTQEIVLSTWAGGIYVIDSKGQAVAGWPKRMALVPSCPLDPTKPPPDVPCMDIKHGYARGAAASPVLVDMDHDGKLEIIQAAFDGNIYVFHADGTPLDGWPVHLHSSRTNKHNRIISTPAVGDVDGDGVPDIASGSNEEIGGGGGSGPAFVVSGKGTKAPNNGYFNNWPLTLVSLHLFPVVAEGVDSAPAMADFDGDGKLDVLLQGNGAPPSVFPADPGTQIGFNDPPNRLPIVTQDDGSQKRGFDPTSVFGELSTAFRPDTMFPLFSHPAIGDLDQDGVSDVIMAGGSLSLAGNLSGGSSAKPFQHLLAMWSGRTGHMMPGSPVVIEDYTFLTNMAVADLSGDDYPEVIVGTGGYFLRAVDACGREAAGWPKFTNGWIISAPAVGDLNGDRKLDVVVATREGFLFAWKTPGSDTGVVQWESFHHDNANTGSYATKLDQGVLKRAAAPIDCSAPPPPPGPETYDAGGCNVGGESTRYEWLVGFALALVGLRRRLRG